VSLAIVVAAAVLATGNNPAMATDAAAREALMQLPVSRCNYHGLQRWPGRRQVSRG
jgi:hypothetical protein